MYEELKMILELLGDLGVYAVWVAVAYFMFKLMTLASYVLLVKYAILGSEDNGLPSEVLREDRFSFVEIEGENSLNVAVAGSIVLYHRYLQFSN